MRLKQLLKNKYNEIGIVFLVTVAIRIGYSFFARAVLVKTGMSSGMMTTLGQLCYVLPGAIYLLFHSENVKEMLHLRKLRIPSVLLLFIIGVLLIPVMAFINGISLLFTTNAIASTMGDAVENQSYFYAISIMAMVPALLEEFMYRGIFFGTFRKAGLWISILTSALLFGLMHMNLNQFCYAMALGIVMAIIVELTGSIFATMIIHFTINGTTTSLSYFVHRAGLNLANQASQTTSISKFSLLVVIGVYGVISLFALAAIIALLYVICTLEKREKVFRTLNPFCKERALPTKTQNLYSLPLLLGIVFCVILIIILSIQ